MTATTTKREPVRMSIYQVDTAQLLCRTSHATAAKLFLGIRTSSFPSRVRITAIDLSKVGASSRQGIRTANLILTAALSKTQKRTVFFLLPALLGGDDTTAAGLLFWANPLWVG